MSLTARLTSLVVFCLGACAVLSAVGFRAAVERSLETDLDRRLDSRMLWIESGIGEEDGALVLEPRSEPEHAAEWWSVARKGGGVLWRAAGEEPRDAFRRRSRVVRRRYRFEGRERVGLEEVPESVLASARRDVPDLHVTESVRIVRGRITSWRLGGEVDELRYRVEVDVAPSGEVLECDVDARDKDARTERVTFEDCPKPVRDTILRELGTELTGTIEVDAYDGRRVWTVDSASRGRRSELRILRDGRLLEKEETIPIADLPPAARATLDRVLGVAEPERVELETRGEQTVYEIEARAADVELHVEIDDAGRLLEKDADRIGGAESDGLALVDLPEPARAVLSRELENLDFEISARIRNGHVVYEAESETDGHRVEISVLEDGSIAYRTIDIDLDELPLAVRAAALAKFGQDAELSRARTTISSGSVIYEVSAAVRGDEMELQFGEDGRRVERRTHDAFPRYRLPPGEGEVELELTAVARTGELDAELARLDAAIWAVGPLALLVAGALIALSIRTQLRPLRRMAGEAERVGVDGFGSASQRIGGVGAARECVRLRDALNAMLERLESGLSRERRFASTAAHELRTPLAQLRSTVDVALRRERSAGEYRDALEQVLADAIRLEKLVTGLLELARSPERVRGRRVLLTSVLERAGAPEGVLEQVPPDAAVEGDEELLGAAVANVIENARRHAREEPEIHVELDGKLARISVADHGPGIPEEDRERIFTPLTTLRRSGRHGDSDALGFEEGFGLGLAIARSSVRAFGGDLRCRGRGDGAAGAEFVFELGLWL